MPTTTQQIDQTSADADMDLACETLYRFFAVCLADPRRNEFQLICDPSSMDLVCRATDVLRRHFGELKQELSPGELPIGELCLDSIIRSMPQPGQSLEDEYKSVFGLSGCRECPPYETEYQQVEDVFFRSQQMADVAGFYRAFGLGPLQAGNERVDYLPLELEFEAFLLLKKRIAQDADDSIAGERTEICQTARQAFFRDHIAWWVPAFSVALRKKAGSGFYEAVGRSLAAFIPMERARLGVDAQHSISQPNQVQHTEECEGCLLNS